MKSKCPRCDGTKKLFAMFINRGENYKDHSHGYLKCDFCEGKGKIDKNLIPDLENSENLREFLKSSHITLKEASLRSGISCIDISKYENGRPLKISIQNKIVKWVTIEIKNHIRGKQ
jgi:hypothetical protein